MITGISAWRKHHLGRKPNLYQPIISNDLLLLALSMTFTGMCLVAQSSPTLCNPMDCSLAGSSVHGDSPGKNTGVGCHFLLQFTDIQKQIRATG